MCVLSPSGFKTHGEGEPVWRGGETEALDRLNKHLDKKVNPNKRWKSLKTHLTIQLYDTIQPLMEPFKAF